MERKRGIVGHTRLRALPVAIVRGSSALHRILALPLVLVLALGLPALAQASKNAVGYIGSEGPGLSQFQSAPYGVAVNEAGTGPGVSPGDIYVVSGYRPAKLQQFDSQGNLVRTVGWDVVSSGPDNTGADEQDTLTIPNTVTAGSFKLTVTDAFGEAESHSNSAVLTNVFASTGGFQIGQPIFMESVPNGTTVTEVGNGTLTLSAPATYGTGTQRTIRARETTGQIPYNATAPTVQAALESLPGIGANGAVVTGGPGASGTPFTITFSGSQNGLGHNDVPPMQVSSQLTGGAADVVTAVEGGGAESCTVADASDVCHNPVEPDHEWQSGSIYFPGQLEVDQATGNVFVQDGQRMEIFRSDGAYEGQVGRGMQTGANEPEFCSTQCKEPLGFDPNALRISDPTVDPTTGHLFGVDTGRIDEFALSKNGSGEVTGFAFLRAFGWGVQNGAEEFQVCTSPAECKPGIEGEGVGQIGNTDDMAVSSTGVLYVSEYGFREEFSAVAFRVQSFTPGGGAYIPSIFAPSVITGTVKFQPLQNLAIGPEDHLFVTNATRPPPSPTCYNGLSPNPSESRILDLNPAGELVDTDLTCAAFTFEWEGLYYTQLAANKATGVLYLSAGLYNPIGNAQNGDRVFIVDDADSAKATIDSVTPNTAGATVVGTINPNGPPATYPHATSTSYQVEYRRSSDPTWSKFSNPVSIGAGTVDHEVTVHLGSLQPNTVYDLRLAAQKPGQSNGYDEQTFQTLKAPPAVNGLTSKHVTKSSAELIAQVNPRGLETTYHFEYGSTNSYGNVTPEVVAGSGSAFIPVHEEITGLQSAVYHFRVVAHNETGTTISDDQTFTFFPPECPNALVRQQNGSGYLPDCRSYELVSPAEAGNIRLLPFDLPAPFAINRFMYAGIDGSLRGTEAPNSWGPDTYVAKRTSNGWHSTYTGIPGSESLADRFVMADTGLDKFLNSKGFSNTTPPYLYDENDNFLERWPSNVNSVPGGNEAVGAFQPSPDFSHLAFSTITNFDPEGLGRTVAPGSAYDYDVANRTTALISKTASGHPIPQDPTNPYSKEVMVFGGMEFLTGEPDTLQVNPGVSTDGSHILMMTATEPPCFSNCKHPTVHLYMRVDDAVTYEIAEGRPVKYIGMTADGAKVFFTTDEALTSEDQDTSTDLYMWSEQGQLEGEPLTLLSAGSGAGNADECHVTWVEKCDVLAVDGDASTDYPIATASGDVYFYSPELLDGPEHGLEGARNLYVFREGHIQFVAQLNIDGSDPVTRIQVSPSGDHAAFVTASRVASYDNAGKEEMYTFSPVTSEVDCASCIPSGESPSYDVEGSVSGSFMSNDGRAFFSTSDALVPRDTNEGSDVYEYVDGQPQLISSGTGATQHDANDNIIPLQLMGVSADGTDAFFATFDTLVSQDHNGAFLKFYDARSGGGFLTTQENAPCEAADECHGAGYVQPPPPAVVTDRKMGRGGNVSATHHGPKKKRKKHHRRNRHHRGGKRHGSSSK